MFAISDLVEIPACGKQASGILISCPQNDNIGGLHSTRFGKSTRGGLPEKGS